jgi:hypothetical protein
MICTREFIASGSSLDALKDANARAVDFVAGLTARGYRAVILARDLRPGEFTIVEAEGGRGFVVEFVRLVGEPSPVPSVPEDAAL